jgi:phage repressor protein C with HTH and peptisase S24 domain
MCFEMSERSNRLAQARKAAGFANATEAAEAFGWKSSTYLGHENGSRGITADRAREYASRFGVAAEWILYGRGPSAVEVANGEAPPTGAELVPVYSVEASAGDGSVVDDEDQVSSLAFPVGYLRRLTKANPRNLKIITVKGDSMLPTIADDDVVMLDVSKHDLSFDGLFVIRDNGDALLVKRIGRATRRDSVQIISDNRELYPPAERRLQDIEVVGRVIWHGRKV